MSDIEYGVEQYDGRTFTLTAFATISADEYRENGANKAIAEMQAFARQDGFPEIITKAAGSVRPVVVLDELDNAALVSAVGDGSYVVNMIFDYHRAEVK